MKLTSFTWLKMFFFQVYHFKKNSYDLKAENYVQNEHYSSAKKKINNFSTSLTQNEIQTTWKSSVINRHYKLFYCFTIEEIVFDRFGVWICISSTNILKRRYISIGWWWKSLTQAINCWIVWFYLCHFQIHTCMKY